MAARSKTAFVAHAYRGFTVADFRDAVQKVLAEQHVTPVYADEVIESRHILEKIRSLILASHFGIYDISNWNPNVTLELGMAMGYQRPWLLLLDTRKRKGVPADLQGFDRIEYDSIKTLCDALRAKVPSFMASGPAAPTVQRDNTALTGGWERVSPTHQRLAVVSKETRTTQDMGPGFNTVYDFAEVIAQVAADSEVQLLTVDLRYRYVPHPESGQNSPLAYLKYLSDEYRPGGDFDDAELDPRYAQDGAQDWGHVRLTASGDDLSGFLLQFRGVQEVSIRDLFTTVLVRGRSGRDHASEVATESESPEDEAKRRLGKAGILTSDHLREIVQHGRKFIDCLSWAQGVPPEVSKMGDARDEFVGTLGEASRLLGVLDSVVEVYGRREKVEGTGTGERIVDIFREAVRNPPGAHIRDAVFDAQSEMTVLLGKLEHDARMVGLSPTT